MSFEIKNNSHTVIISRSIDNFFKIFCVIFGAMSLFISVGVALSSNATILALLFSLTLGVLPIVLSFLGRKTLVIDKIKKEVRIFYELTGFNFKLLSRSTFYNEATAVKTQKVTRRRSKGGSYTTNQIYLKHTSQNQEFILFEIYDFNEARNFLIKISQYLGINTELLNEEFAELESNSNNNLIVTALGAVFFIGLLAFTGFPISLKSKIPDNVKTYVKGKYVCWDKTVCCNPSDKSTCVTIPTCIEP